MAKWKRFCGDCLGENEACCVTAVSDERKGERLVALVAGQNGLTARDVWQKLMATDLPKLWIPKADDIRMVAALPLLGSGKLDLKAARRMAAESTPTAVQS